MTLNETVGIFVLRQQHKVRRLRIGDNRQRRLHGAARGFKAGSITVKRKIDVIGELEKFFHVLGRNGRAERSHRFQKSALGHLDNVHITFTDNRAALFMNSVTRFIKTVKFLTFVIDGCFWRIEIFRLFTGHHCAGAKTDHLSARIADGIHDSTAEAVVTVPVFGNHKTRLFKFRIIVGFIFEDGFKTLPAVGREPQMKLIGGFFRDAAAF